MQIIAGLIEHRISDELSSQPLLVNTISFVVRTLNSYFGTQVRVTCLYFWFPLALLYYLDPNFSLKKMFCSNGLILLAPRVYNLRKAQQPLRMFQKLWKKLLWSAMFPKRRILTSLIINDTGEATSLVINV